jgi:starch phosphorylase
MEFGLEEGMNTYAGGLGVLAGDIIKTFASLGIRAIGITLLNRKGYIRQTVAEGVQKELPDEWKVSEYVQPLEVGAELEIEGKTVKIRAWKKDFGSASVIFLDTDLPSNDEKTRILTDHLYVTPAGLDRTWYRFAQEMVLGIGGVRILQSLGVEVSKFHMNEGHTSLLALELLRTHKDPEKVKSLCIFTTHTPLPYAHEEYSYEFVGRMLGDFLPLETIQTFGGRERLNMTLLGMSLSGYVNAVSEKHAKIARKMFPAFKIDHITNGVHSETWTSKSFQQLYDRYIPGWRVDPLRLRNAPKIPDEEIWNAHLQEKRKLIQYVREKTGIHLSPNAFTIGFARRIVEYKRHLLLFSEPKKLQLLAKKKGDLQILLAGKAHPDDLVGKKILRKLYFHIQNSKPPVRAVFLENYDLHLAKLLTAGVDLWLNLPKLGFEACGTSGMKAAHNGIPQLSTLDGWWPEGCIEGVTGWSLKPAKTQKEEARNLYKKLSKIMELFYNQKEEWIRIMKMTVALIASHFNAHRMVWEYIARAYS